MIHARNRLSDKLTTETSLFKSVFRADKPKRIHRGNDCSRRYNHN